MRLPDKPVQIPLYGDPADQVIAFASGSNHAGEIRGFAAVGQPVGVAADECRRACEGALIALAGTGLPVFVDSGAFSEVTFGPTGPRVVKPISHQDWLDRLAMYKRLADVLGDQLYAVAPDMVGFQNETLERLRKYRPQIAAIRKAGAHILVPFQRGSMSLPEFDRRVRDALGFSDYVVAFPMKKGATEPEAIEAFLDYRKPREIHLLGLGAKNPRATGVLSMIQEKSPETAISIDSNKLKAYVGWEYSEYAKRMKRLGIKPMPKSEWLPQHHLILPGYRKVPQVTPREFTLAREFVGPINPRFFLEIGDIDPRKLGLERLGVDVWTDRNIVDRVDEWLPPYLNEIVRQRKLGDAWEEYQDQVLEYELGERKTRPSPPPEQVWMVSHDEWPLPTDVPEQCEWLYGKSCRQIFDQFMAKPSTWVRGYYWHARPTPAKLTAADYAEMAYKLRPFYLEHLGSQRVNGGTVAAAWRKEQAIQAAFGEGELAREFAEWKQKTRAITSQRDFEMALALRHAVQRFDLSLSDREIVERGRKYPEYEELLLRHWDEIDPKTHWDRERQRAEQRLMTKYGRRWIDHEKRDPYLKWLHGMYRWRFTHTEGGLRQGKWEWLRPPKQVSEILRRVADMRVAQRKGLTASVPAGTPPEAMAQRVPDYRTPGNISGERVANPKALKRRLIR